MIRLLINATQRDEVRVAITDNSLLVDLDVEYLEYQDQKKNNIYKCYITSIEPSLGAVFVNYGSERHGFLPIKEIAPHYFLDQNEAKKDNPDIQKILKLGQELLIQVEKEERGSKGAALTTFISLAGSYLVLMPNNPRAGGISRRIDGEDRDQLRESLSQLTIPDGMGIIIRTAGVGKSAKELQWDLSVLLHYWDAITQASEARSAPYLIHQEGDVIIRALRDYLRQDTSEIIIDDVNAFERAKNYISRVRPSLLDRIKLYQDNLPLFSRFQIEQQIETAYQHEVRLPSGGSIVIDVTEALVSIDINSSRATKGADIEETALNTNIEAAEEIARQLRLRDIGGLIVIDFIDMTPTRNQREVENRLRDALHMDRARIQVGRISRFGLLEMSRQRLQASLNRASQVLCPRCQGQGSIRSVESTALSIIHLIQEKAATAKHIHLQVQLPIDISTYILNEKRHILKEIDEQHDIKVTILPNANLESPQYLIKQSKHDAAASAKDVPSYRMAKAPKAETTTHRRTSTTIEQPAIHEFLTSEEPHPHKAGLMSKIRDLLFGDKEDMPAQPEHPEKRQTSHTHAHKKTGHHHNRTASHHGQGQDGRRERTPRRRSAHQHDDHDKQNTERTPRRRSAAHQHDDHDKHNTERNRSDQQRTRRGNRAGGQSRDRQSPRRGPRERDAAPKTERTHAPQHNASAPILSTPPRPEDLEREKQLAEFKQRQKVEHVETKPAAPHPEAAQTQQPQHRTPPVEKAPEPKKMSEPKPEAQAPVEQVEKKEKKVVSAPASAYQSHASESSKPLQQVTTKKDVQDS